MSHCYSIIYQRTSCKKVLSSNDHNHTNLKVVLKSTLILLSAAWLSFQRAGSCYPYLQPAAPCSLCICISKPGMRYPALAWPDALPRSFHTQRLPNTRSELAARRGLLGLTPPVAINAPHAICSVAAVFQGCTMFPGDGMRKSMVNPSILARKTCSHKNIICIVFLHFSLGRSRRGQECHPRHFFKTVFILGNKCPCQTQQHTSSVSPP